MTALFAGTLLNGMSLKNRFVRSATWEGLADRDGAVTQRLTEMMAALAGGEVGLIISGHAFVSPEGQAGSGQLAVHDDRFLPGLGQMTRAVHEAGGKIALQIAHGGCHSAAGLAGLPAVGPSSGGQNGLPSCRPMTGQDIARVVSCFSRAAGRAKRAGFDAVQIHAAHGYLVSQFLSPAFNRRTDEYGGTLKNRARFLLEVVQGIRKETGAGYPVLVKLNAEDFLPGGLTRDEAVQVSVMLEKASVDAVEYSGGTVSSPLECIPPRPGALKTPEDEVYYREAAGLFKGQVGIPLLLVGGIRSFEVADALIRNGTADYISLARPLISEPGLVKRWREGDRRRADCVSCNRCFGPGLEGKGISCVTRARKRT